MVAREMIRQRFKPGKGLGISLQGINERIALPAVEKFFGLGLHPTPEDITWANRRKHHGWALPQPLPHLYETFVKPKYCEEKEYETFTVEKLKRYVGP